MDVPVAFISPNFLPPSASSGRLSSAKRCHRRRPRPSTILSSASDADEGYAVKDGDTLDKFRADFFSQTPGRFRREVEEETGEDRVLQKLRNQVEDREYSSEYIASVLLKSSFSATEDRDAEDDDKSIWEQAMEIDGEVDEYEELRKKAGELFGVAEEEGDFDEYAPVIEEEIQVHNSDNRNSERLKSLGSKLAEIQTRRSRIDFKEKSPAAGTDVSTPPSSPSRLTIFESMKKAEVITAETAGYNAVTRVAERVARQRHGFPFIPAPIPEIQEAFVTAKTVACMYCTEAFVPEGNDEKFCTTCYANLFLKNDPTTNAPPEERSINSLPVEVRKEVERVWNIRRKRKGGSVSGIRSIPERRQRTVWQMAEENTTTATNNVDTGVVTRSNSSGARISGSNNSNGFSPPPPDTSGTQTRADDWNVAASQRSMRTINPIRNLVQEIDVVPNPGLDLIKLSVGDPTVYGNLKVSQTFIDSYCEAIKSGKHNGYSLSYGSLAARESVAKRYTLPHAPLTPEDVVLSSGTSGALELCIGALCNEGDNILLARPGFPLFATIAEGFGVECRYYDTMPNQRWEVNVDKLANGNIIDGRTAAIVVNNPSNPCGSVYSKEHIQEILAVAEKFHLPVIADEVYADMAFSGSPFHSIGSLSKNVPVLSVGGISKQFVVPGWRLGWICIHDRNDILENGNVRKGMRQLTTRMLVPNSPAQACIPAMLKGGKEDAGFRELMETLEMNAQFTVKALQKAPGMRCIAPQGAMYTMAEIDTKLLGFTDDMHFTRSLLEEESVFVLPGQCFQAPNFVRIVFCAPQFVLSEAFHRIRRFCKRHAKME